MLEVGLVNLVMANAAVKSLCAGGVGGFDVSLPKDQILPTWAYRNPGPEDEPYTLQGAHGFTVRPRFMIDCFGNTGGDAINLATAIDKVLTGWTGTLTDPDQTQVDAIFHRGVTDFFDDVKRNYRRILTYRIQFFMPY